MSNNKPPLIKPKAIPKVGPSANQNQSNPDGAKPAPPVTNPILCKAMDVFKADPNVSTQNTFVQQLFKSRLLIPCSAIKKTEKDGKNEVQLQFLTLKNKQGDNLFGVFTDWDQIKKQAENTPKEAAALPFPEILKIAVSQKGNIKGILINPFEQGLMLDENTIVKMDENLKKAAEQIKAQKAAGEGVQTEAREPSAENNDFPPIAAPIINAAERKKAPEEDILYIGEPLDEPYEITKELSRYFKSVKAVVSAYFLEIYRSDHGKPSPLVVIDYKGDKDTKEKVYNEIREIYNENAEEPMELTIMTSGEKLAKDGIINKKPFYTRKVFGIF